MAVLLHPKEAMFSPSRVRVRSHKYYKISASRKLKCHRKLNYKKYDRNKISIVVNLKNQNVQIMIICIYIANCGT
jgi:hypothetical protein